MNTDNILAAWSFLGFVGWCILIYTIASNSTSPNPFRGPFWTVGAAVFFGPAALGITVVVICLIGCFNEDAFSK
jgi:hypothetical protein